MTTKSTVFQLRLTPEQLRKLALLASGAGLTMSEYIRRFINHQ